jgi:ribonuclease E
MAPRGETSVNERGPAPGKSEAPELSDSGEESQRRSHRRPPRRGRDAESRPVTTEPRDEIRPPREENRSPREERRPQREERRPQRDESRAPREEGRMPREEGRAPREEGRTPREEGRAPREEGRTPRDEGRTPRDEGRTPRDENRTPREERRPQRRAEPTSERSSAARSPSPSPEIGQPRKAVGFGAGIDREDELVEDITDERPNLTRPREDRGTRDRDDATSEDPEGRLRRRRRRGGRGRKREDVNNADANHERAVESEQDADEYRSSRDPGDDEAAQDEAPSIRHTKIPTWNETISVLVEANMLNHQRSQSSQRGNNPRGRGRR